MGAFALKQALLAAPQHVEQIRIAHLHSIRVFSGYVVTNSSFLDAQHVALVSDLSRAVVLAHAFFA